MFHDVSDAGKSYRLGVFAHANEGVTIHVAFSLEVFASDLKKFTQGFWFSLPLAMILIAFGAWFVARRSLDAVNRLAVEMETLSPRNLNHRLEAQASDIEFRRITDAYNAMLARLERSFTQASRFSADASHELKTPLAVMRATLERALQDCADASQEQRNYASLIEETDHLHSIIEALLLLSRADAGMLKLSAECIDFAHWLKPLIEDASLMAEARHITVHEELATSAFVLADEMLLYRALSNLVRNAVNYNHDGGEIRCELRTDAAHVYFRVSNTGSPIPEAERESVFERFKRGSNVGGEGEGRGMGIGLSLAKEIVLAHGGSLELLPNLPGWVSFEVRLPSVEAT
jgi:two-component system, OmpR family, heavy metal sensor histidine kinase CusS